MPPLDRSLAMATVLGESAVVTADGHGTVLDMKDYEGVGLFVLAAHNTAGSSPTLATKLQHSDASGSGMADVTGGAFTGLTTDDGKQVLRLDISHLKRYVQFVRDIGGSSTPSYNVGEFVIANKKRTAH